MLTIEQGTALVRVARRAIETRLSKKPVQPGLDEVNGISAYSGAFVSLFDVRGQSGLRGCVGDPSPKERLDRLVSLVAIEAATNDFRFKPVKLDELETCIAIEVNILSPLEIIRVSEPLDYVR